MSADRSSAATIELDYQRANVLRMRGAFVDAEAALRDVLKRAPGHRDACYSLAYMLREDGRLNSAADVVVSGWKSNPQSADVALAALSFLNECSAQTQAQILACDARVRWPNDARIAVKTGEIALALGEFDLAAMHLRAALDLDPQQSVAWLRLAHCRRYTEHADPDVQRFAAGWASGKLYPAAHICAGFAFGKALDDLADYAQASTVLRAANQLASTDAAWISSRWHAFVEQRLLDAPLPALVADANFVPIFIVGLPRTGTTLVATTLNAHAAVRDRGELNWIAALHAHLQTQGHLQNIEALTAIASLIRAQMRRDDVPARFYIDKNPLNFRYLDFIAALFPNAKIIHCRRDARDTALSLWMQHFAHEDLRFAYAFSSIAEVAAGYARLMTHWRARLPIQIIDVQYEDFVGDAQAQGQRLATVLGIANEAALAAPAASAITTASVWQARQPVYTHAVARWRHYAPYLPELTEYFAD